MTLSQRELNTITSLTKEQQKIATFLVKYPMYINCSDNELVRAVWRLLDKDFNCSTALRFRRFLKNNNDLPFKNYDQERIDELDRANAYVWHGKVGRLF